MFSMAIDSTTETSSKSKSLPLVVKWERRKRPSTAYAPSLRSGCTMTAWPAKSTGILFGGVTDEDTNEETLESVFWNDLSVSTLVAKHGTLSLFSVMATSGVAKANGFPWLCDVLRRKGHRRRKLLFKLTVMMMTPVPTKRIM